MTIFDVCCATKSGVNPTPDSSLTSSIANAPWPAQPTLSSLKVNTEQVPTPISLDYKYKSDNIYCNLYNAASYYFYHCLPFATIVKRMTEETMRKGLEWVPRFQSKCPRCGMEYKKNVTSCQVCHYEGTFLKPNPMQQSMLINREGHSLIEKCNSYNWTLEELCVSFLTVSLVYNQPIILARSTYFYDTMGNLLGEVPGEFIPVSPTAAKYIIDIDGTPGDKTGFTLADRSVCSPMDNPAHPGFDEENHRLYPSRWRIGEDNGYGTSAVGLYYGDGEVYHQVFGIPSLNYGMPLILLASIEVRALIAIASRTRKYYETGHPLGILVIAGIDNSNMSAMKRQIQEVMNDDPYATPLIGIPPVRADIGGAAKWIPFADNPTSEMVAVKRELIERVCAFFGIPSFVMGDLSNNRGVSNEEYQIALLDRSLLPLRKHVNSMLDWIVKKYPMITDWYLHVVEPPDKEATDDEDAFGKKIENAKGLRDLNFRAVSQGNGEIEMSSTPDTEDPFTALSQTMLNPRSSQSSDGDVRPSKTNAPKNPIESMTKSISGSDD